MRESHGLEPHRGIEKRFLQKRKNQTVYKNQLSLSINKASMPKTPRFTSFSLTLATMCIVLVKYAH